MWKLVLREPTNLLKLAELENTEPRRIQDHPDSLALPCSPVGQIYLLGQLERRGEHEAQWLRSRQVVWNSWTAKLQSCYDHMENAWLYEVAHQSSFPSPKNELVERDDIAENE